MITKYIPSKFTNIAMSHQDWKPCVLSKKPRDSKQTHQSNQPIVKSTQPNVSSANLRRLDSDENYIIPHVNLEMGRKIVQGRTQLKLSQDQLAKRCSIPLAVLKDYEQGKGVYNRAYLDQVCRVLGIVLSKPRQKQSTTPQDTTEDKKTNRMDS